MARFHETGWAKINLALHVRARRVDGYHAIETLFAFLDDGDRLSAEPADDMTLTHGGPFAGALDGEGDNLILRAARAWQSGGGQAARFTLDKRLPVAAGIGGGSADAAAALRLLAAIDGGSLDARAHRMATALGADVPACLISLTRCADGIGTSIWPVVDDVAGMAVLLVNPGVPLSTGPVFAAWDGVDRGGLAQGVSARAIALAGRNDLEAPAIALCPPIADALAALSGEAPLLARMSGSGATCFALFDNGAHRDAAAVTIARARPDWWLMAGALR